MLRCLSLNTAILVVCTSQYAVVLSYASYRHMSMIIGPWWRLPCFLKFTFPFPVR